jgi:hypothetical protein
MELKTKLYSRDKANFKKKKKLLIIEMLMKKYSSKLLFTNKKETQSRSLENWTYIKYKKEKVTKAKMWKF